VSEYEKPVTVKTLVMQVTITFTQPLPLDLADSFYDHYVKKVALAIDESQVTCNDPRVPVGSRMALTVQIDGGLHE